MLGVEITTTIHHHRTEYYSQGGDHMASKKKQTPKCFISLDAEIVTDTLLTQLKKKGRWKLSFSGDDDETEATISLIDVFLAE